MRSVRDENGNKLFIPAEYFTREEVISLFSRMARKKRSGELSEPIQLQEDNLEPLEEQDVDDEGDYELFADENEAMVEELLNDVKNFDELKSGSFICVGLVDKACSNPSKANTKHYVGQILSAEEEEFRITCMRQKGSYFVWPEKEDIAFTDIDDIHLCLSMPLVDRRQHCRFEDVEMEQMKNCCQQSIIIRSYYYLKKEAPAAFAETFSINLVYHIYLRSSKVESM